MKKALFISTLQIFPALSGGQLRSARVCEVLANSGFLVEIYSLTGRREDYLARKQSSENAIQPGLSEFVNRSPFWAGLQFLSYKFDLPPVWATLFLSFYLPRNLKKKMQQADLIVLDFPFLLPLLKGYEGKTWVNTHNAEYELWSHRPWLAQKVRNIEEQAFRQAQKVLFCSDLDLAKFEKTLPGLTAKSHVVPNGVELAKYEFTLADKEQNRRLNKVPLDKNVFLFAGSAYAPNIEAAQFLKSFALENAEALKRHKILILIAGTVLEKQEATSELIVLGRVDDMKQCLAMCDFGLNPVASGSGVNVKMIELLASHKPTLATETGWRGLQLREDSTGWVFERQTLLDKMIKAVHFNDSQRTDMGQKAYNLNVESLEMDRSLKKLVNQNEMQVHL